MQVIGWFLLFQDSAVRFDVESSLLGKSKDAVIATVVAAGTVGG